MAVAPATERSVKLLWIGRSSRTKRPIHAEGPPRTAGKIDAKIGTCSRCADDLRDGVEFAIGSSIDRSWRGAVGLECGQARPSSDPLAECAKGLYRGHWLRGHPVAVTLPVTARVASGEVSRLIRDLVSRCEGDPSAE